jgi:cytochrome c-type biogenesis protein CcmH
MKCMFAIAFAALVAFAVDVRAAGEAVPTEKDPVSQARAVRLTERLRCLVCQNQTIAESNADLAVDLRRQVREQIAAGKTDTEITDYMVARYGDFVLYDPPLRATTLLLWGGPALLLAAGIALLVQQIRSRRAAGDAAELTPEERTEAERMLTVGALPAPSPRKEPT